MMKVISIFDGSYGRKVTLYIPGDKKEAQRQVLLKVVRFFGSVQAYSDALGVGRSRVSNWVNQGNEFPYQYAVVTADIAPISIDSLSPSNVQANAIIKRLRSHNKLLPVEVPIHSILTEDPNDAKPKQNQPVIVNPKGVVIAGTEQLKAYKAAGMNKIWVIVLDWEELL